MHTSTHDLPDMNLDPKCSLHVDRNLLHDGSGGGEEDATVSVGRVLRVLTWTISAANGHVSAGPPGF